MGMNLDPNTFNKVVDVAKNVSSIGANLLDKQPKQPQVMEPKQDNVAQVVEVKVGHDAPPPKLPSVKEKSDTPIIQKVFPDARELNERECQVRELELKQEHEYKMAELNFRMATEAENRKDKREKEEYERKERERRRERDRRFSRNMGICFAGAGIIALGFAAYDFYTNSRNSSGNGLALGKSQAVNLAPNEGSVT